MEQLENRIPETDITEQAPATTATTSPASATSEAKTGSSILDGYLVGGYYKGEGKGKYPDPDLVDQAEEIASELLAGGVTITAFNKMLRTLKGARRLSYEAQKGALKMLMPQVVDLENRKKAPPLLREIVEANRAAVKTSEDFAACLEHLQTVGIYLSAAAASIGK